MSKQRYVPAGCCEFHVSGGHAYASCVGLPRAAHEASEPCTCGSGNHPRYCNAHPEAMKEHVTELNTEPRAAHEGSEHRELSGGYGCSCGWKADTASWRAHAAHMRRRGGYVKGLGYEFGQKPEPTEPTDEPRYFEGTDGSCHHYIIPWDRRNEWAKWRDLPDDDEAGWEEPEWAKRIDGGTLTFTNPRIDKW